jgi:hypothetical protein
MGSVRPPAAPADLGKAGRDLWRGVVKEFDLGPSDLVLLRQAADVADHCEQLREAAALVPPVVRGRLGQELGHPAWSELRSERRLLLALLGGLGLTANAVEAPDNPVPLRERGQP